MKCFECGKSATYKHHVIPKSLGGKNKIPLCEICHGKIHNIKMIHSSTLIKNKMLEMKLKNRRISGIIPYGYDLKGNNLIKNSKEQTGINIILNFYHKGLSLRKIALKLSLMNIKTKSGTAWSATVIRGIIKRNLENYK